jgi:glycosyltransferase involved in cell wall biosynthesis
MPTVLSVFGVKPVRIGGTETFARELSRQLAARDWQSVLCFLSKPTDDVRRFLDLPNNTFEVLENSTNGTWSTRWDLMRLLRKHRPEILHLHFVSFLTLYPWLARLGSVEKILFTDHHSRPAGYVAAAAPLWKQAAARTLIRPLDKVICVSRYGYGCMTSLGLLPRDRYEMIYNGVDLSRTELDPQRALAFRQRYSIPNDRAIVTQVSWLIPEKGIADFLEVARLVTAQDRNTQFVLVGDGQHRNEYFKQAASMGLSDRVTFTGMIDDPFGAGVYEAADIVCQFSRWEEVFGWMIAEAMAHQKPVIGARVGGIPELITDGATGHLVERQDTKAMSAAVLTLLKDRDKRDRMGQAARAIVEDKFDLRKNVAKLIEVYGIS